MKCPNCEYKYGYEWDADELEGEDHYGEYGVFYKSPVKLEREYGYGPGMDQRSVYGCPSCRIVFMVE